MTYLTIKWNINATRPRCTYGLKRPKLALETWSKVLNVLTPLIETAQLCVVEFYSLVRGVLFQHGESYPNNSTHDYLMST